METSWTQELLNWISANPAWSGVAIFFIAFVESLVLVGFLLPGIFILFGVGALIGLGVAETLPIWIGGTLGAICGDLISFWIGLRYRNQLREMWPFSKYPTLFLRGTEFFRKHGAKSVVAGRFIGPLRPIIPTTAGSMGMSPARFIAICVPACIAWTPAYLIPGMLFGASLEVASEYAGRLALVLAIVVAVVWLSLWAFRLLYEISAVYSARWLRRAIRWSRRHPVLGRVAGPIIDPSQPEVLSVSMLGLLLVLALWSLVLLLFLSPFGAEPGNRDLAVLAWTQTLRNDITDPIMVSISQLSRWWVLLPTSIATLLWLLGAQRYKAASHWLVAMGGGSLLHLLMSWSLRSTPVFQASGAEQLFVPSAPMTMATVVLGFFSVMVAKELHRRHRKWPYLASTLLLILLIMARIYLGLDWLSGALTGFILGMAWTVIVGMAYRARALRPFSGAMAATIFYGTLAVTLTWQTALNLDSDVAAMRIPIQERSMDETLWWDGGWATLPKDRTTARSVAARRFNLQVSVPHDMVRAQLEPGEWQILDPVGWRWIIHSLNPEVDERTLPLTGKNFRGHRESLVLRLPGEIDGQQKALRLWDSGVRLQPGGERVYLGQYNTEQLVTRLKLFSHWRATPLEAGELLVFSQQLEDVELQEVAGDLLVIRLRPRPGSVAENPPGTEDVE